MSNKNILGGLSADAQQAWRLSIYARKTQEHLARRAKEDEETVLREAKDIENRKIMEAILAENEYKTKIDAYNLRELQNRNLEEDLKRQFMANPAATEQTWLICKADVLKNYFIERMNAEKSRDEMEAEKYAGYRM
jgi:L-lysine 2,3-aminomutase